MVVHQNCYGFKSRIEKDISKFSLNSLISIAYPDFIIKIIEVIVYNLYELSIVIFWFEKSKISSEETPVT